MNFHSLVSQPNGISNYSTRISSMKYLWNYKFCPKTSAQKLPKRRSKVMIISQKAEQILSLFALNNHHREIISFKETLDEMRNKRFQILSYIETNNVQQKSKSLK